MPEGMMGRSSDTRMYAPRSESSHMFRENHEDERTRTGTEDPRDSESKLDKRQAKKEKEEEEDRGIRHIKVRRHHLSAMHDDEEEEEGLDDSTKLDADREVGLQTNPMGTGGFLTSLAMGAKGPGAAHGHMVATGEPMEHAWSTLLKAPPYKPKGLPTGVPHAVNTGKSRAETERDIHADIQRRNRTNIPVMSNLNESLLTSAQREQLPAMRNLIARYGGVANIPPNRL